MNKILLHRSAIVALLFVIFLISAKAFDLDKAETSTRLQFHAMPVAMSVIYHDWPHDYTANWQVAMAFQNPNYGSFEDKIALVQAPNFNVGGSTYHWNVDDRGLADYAIFSTLLFGPSLEGLFYFYFVLLGITIIAFVIGHWNSSNAISYLAVTLTALLACLPIWVVAPMSTGFSENSVHMSESRLFGLLAIIPVVHIYFFTRLQNRITRLKIGALIFQILFFCFLYHARSSIIWQMGALFTILGFWEFLSFQRNRVINKKTITTIIVVAISVLTLLPTYKYIFYNSAYFDHSGPRTIWHNILMGMSFSPVIATKLQIGSKVDDALAIRAVVNHIKITRHKDDPNFSVDTVTQNALNSLGSHSVYNWATHENVARTIVMNQIIENPVDFFKLFAFDKPRALLTYVGCLLTPWHSTCAKDNGKKYIAPTKSILPWLLLSGLLTFIAASWRRYATGIDTTHSKHEAKYFTIVLALFALIPPIVFYPSLTTGAAWAMCMLILTFLFIDQFGCRFGAFLARKSTNLASKI